MSLNNTPSGERVRIGFFGRRNAGKSSLVNAVTNQETSLVSKIKGTTTDPVYKSMELLPLGPVTIIDTAGIDDIGDIGLLRVEKTKDILKICDICVLVIDVNSEITHYEDELLNLFKENDTSYIIVNNKIDTTNKKRHYKEDSIVNVDVSSVTKEGIKELKNVLSKTIKSDKLENHLIKDILTTYEIVVLVVPIDSGAPKGRLILPQQQTIRDILEANAITVVVRETELKYTLKILGEKVSLVVTDSQIFNTVSKIVPENILLTSFSILFARYKGELKTLVNGAYMLEKLKDGDKVLICEGCTHHRQCDDIGTIKLPKWIKEYTNKNIEFTFLSGGDFKSNLYGYSLIVHCGGCMLQNKDVLNRIKLAKKAGVPITNYGTLIAYINKILKRVIEPFKEI